ncbi:hypothetical protein TNCV_2134361 [Trichonephila clavipes]|nr:hypothetical protein TNCV_2134361 [Trichonephila clavipes]
MKDWTVQPLKTMLVVDGIVMEGMTIIQRTPSENKKRIISLLSVLVQIDHEVTILNGLLHSNDYEER